jgi:hypothetical protein
VRPHSPDLPQKVYIFPAGSLVARDDQIERRGFGKRQRSRIAWRVTDTPNGRIEDPLQQRVDFRVYVNDQGISFSGGTASERGNAAHEIRLDC